MNEINDEVNFGSDLQCCQLSGMVGLAPKWVILDLKLDKSGTFSDQISVHLAR